MIETAPAATVSRRIGVSDDRDIDRNAANRVILSVKVSLVSERSYLALKSALNHI